MYKSTQLKMIQFHTFSFDYTPLLCLKQLVQEILLFNHGAPLYKD